MKHNSINIFLLKISVIKQSIYKSNKHIQTLFVLLNPTQWSWLDIFMSQIIKKKKSQLLQEKGLKAWGLERQDSRGQMFWAKGGINKSEYKKWRLEVICKGQP